MHTPIELARRYWTGRGAARYATARGLPGMEFDRYGRRVGRRLLARLAPGCAGYLVAPVSNLRYWEFPFALGCLPAAPGACLDVSSPRLFSYYVAERWPQATIDVINPDPQDYSMTDATARRLGLSNLHVRHAGVDLLARGAGAEGLGGPYDCIWSISVIEHIAGAYDERQALAWMWEALRPGGRLILTVPVDRAYEDEYRDADLYQTQGDGAPRDKYFFQRVYDEASLRERIIGTVGREPTVLQWYGETRAGKFREMERAIIAAGLDAAVGQPRDMVEHFRTFASWSEMPGFGVCGLMFEKS
jgi:SAM-dependent methyltransferase